MLVFFFVFFFYDKFGTFARVHFVLSEENTPVFNIYGVRDFIESVHKMFL